MLPSDRYSITDSLVILPFVLYSNCSVLETLPSLPVITICVGTFFPFIISYCVSVLFPFLSVVVTVSTPDESVAELE